MVGEDNAKFGWLSRFPDFHDVPGQDITLAGVNFESVDPLGADKSARKTTGAFLPFGTPSQPGQVVRGKVKCSGSVLRIRPDGGEPELVAWGFRNPFGLAFSPAGKLYITDNGLDDRGSRPVWGTPDFLWELQPGAWYGWPDFVGGEPITHEQFRPPGKVPLRFVLAQHPSKPPHPKSRFAVHSSADGFDFSRNAALSVRTPGAAGLIYARRARGTRGVLIAALAAEQAFQSIDLLFLFLRGFSVQTV